MAMVTCPECSKEISDQAAACPQCGAPVKVNKSAAKQKRKTTPAAWAGLVAIIAGIWWSSNSREY